MDKEYEDWLASLKVGDEVCYSSQWHGYVIETIEKITPTRQIKTSHNTYKNGRTSSGAWNTNRLQPITQKVRDSLRSRKLYGYIRDYKFDKLTLEQLEKVHAVIKDFD